MNLRQKYRSILALETSTSLGSVAMWQEGEVTFSESFSAERGTNSLLFAPLEKTLSLGCPELIVVGLGPGSYTGVRIALSAALGVSLAHGVPLMGLPSLEACAVGSALTHVIGDARRGSFFHALLSHGRLTKAPELVEGLEALELAITGSSTLGSEPIISCDTQLPALGATFASRLSHQQPTATHLAEQVARYSAEEIAALAGTMPEPLYLRAPFITVAKERRLPSPVHPLRGA